MAADNDSRIAWHRVQLKNNREALKALETTRFTVGEIAGSKMAGQTHRNIAELKRKISESERCIAAHERQSKRPLTTDIKSLANMSWGDWNARSSGRQ
jgi:hypothetical protein